MQAIGNTEPVGNTGPVMDAANSQAAIPTKSLVAILFAALAAMQVMLLAFLGFGALAQLASAGIVGAVTFAMLKMPGWERTDGVSPKLLAGAFAFSLMLFLLGGEGRLFYANTDWTVRNAVLRDLAANPWPFVYDAPSGSLLLRAPLGMYLGPGLIGKGLGFHAAEVALLLQNSALLTLLLGIGSTLYRSTRDRVIALTVFTGFSGMDVLGQLIAHQSLLLHLEQWADLQYTSHLAQAFWVPQHAMAGWAFALLYLMWVERRIPRVVMLAAAPMLALFSPLALIGCLPFAAHAGIAGLRDRTLEKRDFLLPAITSIVSVPSLIYLTAAGSSVSSKFEKMPLNSYIVFIILEVAVYIFALYKMRDRTRFGPATATIVLVVLLIAPFGKIGDAADFVMRASIPALAVLSLIIADLLIRRPAADDKSLKVARNCALVAFCIGLCTPISEIARSIMWPRSPEIKCSYMGIVPFGDSTYVARLDRVPAVIRPAHPAIIRPVDPAKCWDGAWPDATTGQETVLENGDLAPQ